jgi:DNA-binding phage protein|tara:strand:+ start:454 stop:684 length:231 start_codon:yes stop_codon:yes gene_type:complete
MNEAMNEAMKEQATDYQNAKISGILKDIVTELQDRNLTVVAERTGISRNTLKNIRDGRNINPTLSVLSEIYSYLEI